MTAAGTMGRKTGSKRKKWGRMTHMHKVAEPLEEMSPTADRKKNFTFDGLWLDHGIRPIDVAVASGGQITGSAFINTMEARALDGLMAARYLDDPRDSTLAFRRHMAGILLRKIFQISEIQSRSTGLYDKPLNAMLGGGEPPRKSEKAEDHEAEFIRLMKLVFPYNTVLMNICCLDERPPDVVRHVLTGACHWKLALCRGLDIIAEDKFTKRNTPRRRRFTRQRSTETA